MRCAMAGMRQLTVSENVVVCDSDPDVAVTVTVDVVDLELDDPPPQPMSRLSPTPHTASRRSICKLRRFFHRKQHKTAASAAPGNSGLELWRRAAVVADVLTVSVVVAAALEGVTVCGLKLHDAPEGSPEQLNETVELKPFIVVSVIVVVAL